MTSVLSGEMPDRVPFYPTIYFDHACVACGKRFEDVIVNPALAQEFMLEAARHYGTDVVRFMIGPESSWYESKSVVERDGKLVQVDRKSGDVEGYFDTEGGGKLISLEAPKFVRTLQDVHDIDVISAEEYLQRGCFKDVAKHASAAQADGFFIVGMCASQTLNFMVQHMGSPEAAMLLYHDDPKLAFALIDRAVAISIEKVKAYKLSGVDGVLIGDSYASASVISPDIYRRFCVPAYTQMAEEIRKMALFSILHCCGSYNPLLDMLPEIGVDAMDGIDPTNGMSVEYTKRRIGSQLTLNGGMSCLTLLNGTKEEVTEEAKRCLEEGMPGGRFSLGSACAVPRFTPPANLMAVKHTVLQYGNYA